MEKLTTGVTLIIVLGFGITQIWGMIVKKKIYKKYNEELKLFPSILHAFFMGELVSRIITVPFFILSDIQKNIGQGLLRLVVYLVIGYIYVKIRSKTLKEKFPGEKIKKILFDQYLMGWGTLFYACTIGLCKFIIECMLSPSSDYQEMKNRSIFEELISWVTGEDDTWW